MVKYTEQEAKGVLYAVRTGKELSARDREILTDFVDDLMNLVEQASQEDFYGTEGWEASLGWK